MLGRAVLVLCFVVNLVGVAGACPPPIADPPDEQARFEAALAQAMADARSEAPAALTDVDPGGDSRGIGIAFMLMGLCSLAFAITRGNAVRRTFATSRHFAAADLVQLQLVARAQRSRTIWFACACAVALGGIAALPIEVEAQIALVVTPTMLITISIIALCRLQLLLGLQPEPGLRVMSHGPYLFAARGKRLVGWVGATPSMMARTSGLPTAVARRV